MPEILAIDPGPVKSSYVVFDGEKIVQSGTEDNLRLIERLPSMYSELTKPVLVIEEITSYGMAVGKSVFDTVFWYGRFFQSWPGDVLLIPRRQVKLHLTGRVNTRDSDIRRAVILRLDSAAGKLRNDEWQAAGLALVAWKIAKSDGILGDTRSFAGNSSRRKA